MGNDAVEFLNFIQKGIEKGRNQNLISQKYIHILSIKVFIKVRNCN